jgi:chemotaxis protein MotB
MAAEFEDDDDIEKPAGLPGWMGTFADMMALLMCFFVLLFAFSEVDAQKFKRLAGAMKNAFGVQNEIAVEDIPKGISVIADSFGPGRPEPTPIKTIEQSTVDSSQEFLDRSTREKLEAQALQEQRKKQYAEQHKINRELLVRLSLELTQELQDGVLELEMLGQQIIFRIRERGSFGSASAFLQPRFKPVILKITRLLNTIPGAVSVAGHTDSQPVVQDMFDNNWDLSAKRAVAVASQMIRVADFDTSRMTVTGHASNQPLMNENSIVARQANRRVEIIVTRGKPTNMGSIAVPDEH